MMLKLRNSEGKLVAKDILSISMDMSVERDSTAKDYFLRINSMYVYDEVFHTEEDAEEELSRLAECRNNLEAELRNIPD